MIKFTKMSIQTKYESLSPEAQKQIEGYLDYLLSKEQKVIDEHISIEQYNKELDEAEAAMDRGEYISHEDFKKEMDQW